MAVTKRKATDEETSEEFFTQKLNTNNGYIISDGNRLDSIIDDLSKVLDTFGLQLIDVDFGASDYFLKIEPKQLNTYPISDLDFHKKLLSRLTNNGIKGDVLHHHIQDVWDDAIKSVAIVNNTKKNTATDESLNLFANFIVQGVDIEGLVQAYEEDVFDRLYGLTNEELEKEEAFYNYSLEQNKEIG